MHEDLLNVLNALPETDDTKPLIGWVTINGNLFEVDFNDPDDEVLKFYRENKGG
jgi:hypothetical protein